MILFRRFLPAFGIYLVFALILLAFAHSKDPDKLQYFTLIATLFGSLLTLVLIAISIHNSDRTRRVTATNKLFEELRNSEFTLNRLQLWTKLESLILERRQGRLTWDYNQWASDIRNVPDTTKPAQENALVLMIGPLTKDEFVALNQIAALYKQLRCMYAESEVEPALAFKLFQVNYRFWDKFRRYFHADTGDEVFQDLFVPVYFIHQNLKERNLLLNDYEAETWKPAPILATLALDANGLSSELQSQHRALTSKLLRSSMDVKDLQRENGIEKLTSQINLLQQTIQELNSVATRLCEESKN